MTSVASPAVLAGLRGNAPTDEQWTAITHPLEPIHLIAGAGSGKTAVMAARIAWIIETCGYSPSQVLGLTFTNKAAEELEQRVRGALVAMDRPGDEEMTVQTYHAFAARIVREHGLLEGVEPDASLLSEAQQWQLVLSCIDDLPAFEAIELRPGMGIVRATLELSSRLADHIVGTSDVEAAADRILASRELIDDDIVITAQKRKELCRAVDAYQAAKARRQRIDFGDQVTRAVAILERHKDVRDLYRERFPIVLLDEYQDTNVAQRRLIQALVPEGGAVTAVGDARQAIYAFRGATMYNLIGFPNDFPRPGSADAYPAVSLSENFRSGSKILEVANSVVAGIDPERRPGAPLRSHPGNGAGRVLAGVFSDERVEADWIAGQCEELHGRATAEGREPVKWKDIAILVRRKAAMAALVDAFAKRDIPLEVVGLGGLLKTPEVTEVVAWLRCLETRPGANRWLARVLMGPRWRINYRDLALCARWAAGRNIELRLRLAGGDEEIAKDLAPGDVGFSLIETLDHLDEIEGLGDEAKRRLSLFYERVNDLRQKKSLSLLELVQEVTRSAGIFDALSSSASRAAAAARQNLTNFFDQVAAFSPVEGEANLQTFLAYLDAADEAEETLESAQPAEQDSVKLMTIHQAKGLEFECVFLPSVAAGKKRLREGEAPPKGIDKNSYVYSIFPNTRTTNPLTTYTDLPYEVRHDSSFLPRWTGKLAAFKLDVRDRVLEDERRLFYVALTRAKQRLAVTAAHWYGREKAPKGPSLFLDELCELGDGLVEVVSRSEAPEENPIVAALGLHTKWPPVPRTGVDDPLLPEGWGVAAEEVVAGRLQIHDLMDRLPADERARAQVRAGELALELELLVNASKESAETSSRPSVLSATNLVKLRSGDLSYSTLQRPLPERPNARRMLGTQIHRLIEEQARSRAGVTMGVSTYPDEEELDEPSDPEDIVDATAAAIETWKSKFGDRVPARLPSGELMLELPFSIRSGDDVVRGRIDAVYDKDDGGLEIVDWKTGIELEVPEFDQLALYAAALSLLGVPAGEITLTYFYLASGEMTSRTLSTQEALRQFKQSTS